MASLALISDALRSDSDSLNLEFSNDFSFSNSSILISALSSLLRSPASIPGAGVISTLERPSLTVSLV